MRIGKLKLKNNLFLSPMVDVTDLPYRLICRRQGAGMAYTEMIYVNAILHSNPKTLQMMKTCKEDSPLGLQITGNNEKEFEEFVKSGKWKKFELIDLNCGCPSSRIVGNESGSFLLKEPEKIGQIVRVLKKTGKPISVKVRLGFNKVNVLEVARVVEKAGASAITVHCRLAKEGNNVRARWEWLGRVKKAVKIPVIGNGDVFSRSDYLKISGICNGVMVGRGAIGDPLVFRRILGEGAHPPSIKLTKKSQAAAQDNLLLFLEYLKLAEKYDLVDINRIRWLGGRFLKGFKGAVRAREGLMGLKTLNEIRKFIKSEVLMRI